jgi:hypothetical protein
LYAKALFPPTCYDGAMTKKKKPWELLPVGRKRSVNEEVTHKLEEAFAMNCTIVEAFAYAGIEEGGEVARVAGRLQPVVRGPLQPLAFSDVSGSLSMVYVKSGDTPAPSRPNELRRTGASRHSALPSS